LNSQSKTTGFDSSGLFFPQISLIFADEKRERDAFLTAQTIRRHSEAPAFVKTTARQEGETSKDHKLLCEDIF
jgi:hypothetical protein